MKKLERTLSLGPTIAIAISAMIGSGIFVLPGLAAAKTGPSVWLAYLLAGVCVLPAVFSKSELATAMPTSGGAYVYIERAFGPLAGTIAGFGLWLSLLLKSSFALIGFSAYLLVLSEVPLKPTALFLLILITALNVVGVRKVGQAQVIVVILSLAGLIALLIFGSLTVEKENLEPAFTHGPDGFLAATAFIFISYAGVTKIAAVAGEIKKPGYTLPRAMLISLALMTVLYAAVTFTLVGNIPVEDLSNDYRPVYTLANFLGGKTAGIIASVLGVITMTSMANAGLLAASRFPFAMSRDNLLPTVLTHVHPRYKTPVLCILLTGFCMAIAIFTFDVERIAKLASVFKVMAFIAMNLCVIVLRETAVQWYKPSYSSPFYPWIQLFGILSGIVLIVVLGGLAVSAAFGLIVVGLVVYFSYGRSRAKQHGVLRVYGRRALIFLMHGKSGRDLHNKTHAVEEKARPSASFPRNDSLVGILTKEAEVVVPLFGSERSAETLVEVGAAIADGRKLQVVQISERPYQTVLEATLVEEEATERSLNRRIKAMSEEKNVDVEFDAVVTHDLLETVQEISETTHCSWMVMGWAGRDSPGAGLFVRNPIGWLITHLSCNLALFKDAGVRYIRQILVYAERGPHEELVASTADHLAEIYGAQLTFIRVIPEGTEDTVRQSEIEYLNRLSDICEAPSRHLIVYGADAQKQVIKETVGFDLLVTGAPPEENLFQIILGTAHDRLTEQAACSVLRLTTPRSR